MHTYMQSEREASCADEGGGHLLPGSDSRPGCRGGRLARRQRPQARHALCWPPLPITPPLAHPPPLRHTCPMIANPNSRSPGSIPNNRCDTLAPPVPILPRATPPYRRVPSSWKWLEVASHVTIYKFQAFPILRPGTPIHPHSTRVNRTSCAQNNSPLTLFIPLQPPKKSTFSSSESRPPSPPPPPPNQPPPRRAQTPAQPSHPPGVPHPAAKHALQPPRNPRK